jgi:3-oxoacyl-[acyl-carrier protein] reductase
MPFDLAGKVALVTGGGRGIGAAIATRLAEAGAAVVIANRTTGPAVELAADLVARGFVARAAPLPGLSRQALTDLVDQAAGERGRLDILVHNAGSCPWTLLSEMTEPVLEETLAVNLSACFWLSQAAIPWFERAGRGRILITSSVTGPRTAMAKATHYAAAKAGVNGFIKAAALELAPRGITVNGVEPGFISKPGRGSLSTPEVLEAIAHFVPLGHAGRPDDIAFAMLYLASDEAAYITGQTIVVDGGGVLPETGLAMDKLRAKR